MKALTALLLGASLTLASLDASAKPPRRPATRMVEKAPAKPTLCTAGSIVRDDTGALLGFLCTDGKRPKLFVRWVDVSFVDSDGAPASYVLGWSSHPEGK